MRKDEEQVSIAPPSPTALRVSAAQIELLQALVTALKDYARAEAASEIKRLTARVKELEDKR